MPHSSTASQVVATGDGLRRPTRSDPKPIPRSPRYGGRGHNRSSNPVKDLKVSGSLPSRAHELLSVGVGEISWVRSLPTHPFNHRRAEQIIKAHLQLKDRELLGPP